MRNIRSREIREILFYFRFIEFAYSRTQRSEMNTRKDDRSFWRVCLPKTRRFARLKSQNLREIDRTFCLRFIGFITWHLTTRHSKWVRANQFTHFQTKDFNVFCQTEDMKVRTIKLKCNRVEKDAIFFRLSTNCFIYFHFVNFHRLGKWRFRIQIKFDFTLFDASNRNFF